MSWQSTIACWFIRRKFRPHTLRTTVNAEAARAVMNKGARVPRVPAGWTLREQYGPSDAPLYGEWFERAGAAPTAPVILYLHGGGYYFCSPRTHRAITFGLGTRTDARVFSLDYRLAPEHPFPAALDDALAAYRQLVAQGTSPESIVIAGDSAGGGLALATLVALRDAGDVLPAGAILFSAWTDLAATGATIRTNDGADPMFSGPAIGRAAKLYLGDTPATNPYASPLYADLHGLPPLFMQAASTEVLLDDSRRVADSARAVGVTVDFEIWPKMPHVWQIWTPFIPEARRALDRAADFVRQVTRVETAQSASEMSIV
ncbi:alpha/beta hydrolase [Paraburkholderia megapolitana]|uniref:Acetyl esterase/lipase n=1 Tax=Paraburkholderia megapolitana TaxID=420953 RepID=A0A1I3G4F1_9BURK|nr:alpha/beta hydrolase [Paraburkholderia megapolitana]QDQ82707.1 alpha/beta hydrolase [Paraburkholderia megapolitana]SFI18314.1 Acetyl esterase/lipase [Paraburkholderia megapolitana]